MPKLNKHRLWIISVALILILGWAYSSFFSTQTLQQESIRVAGIKPVDATVKVWANYRVFGEDCESYSYDMFGQKAHRGGKITTFFTQNEAESDDRYEFQVPYSTYTDGKNCTVELRDFKVEAYNDFDTVGFAQLRIYEAGTEYNKKPTTTNSTIEARNCRARYYDDLGEWSSGLACSFYTNGEVKNKKTDLVVFNAYTVHFDFSQFTTDTVIHYDILAGDDYRSEPLNPQTGK